MQSTSDIVGARSGPNQPGEPPNPARSQRWRRLAVLNLLLGAALLALESTDYVIVATIPNLLFAPGVCLLGLITLWTTRRAPPSAKRTTRLACVPSVLLGLPHLAIGIFMTVLVLPVAFGIAEIQLETVIQQAPSPGGQRTALVRFWPVGAYGQGNGRVAVDVQRTGLPLVARRVYSLGDSVRASDSPSEYVTWLDDDTLYIAEQRRRVSLQESGFQPPLVVSLATSLANWLLPTDRTAAGLLAEVPIFPGRSDTTRVGTLHWTGLSYRSYTVDRSPTSVYTWYRDALSAEPWTIVRLSEQHDEAGPGGRLRYCVQIERARDSGERRTVYVSILGRDRATGTAFVNVTSPTSINEACLGGYDLGPDDLRASQGP